MYPLNCVYNLVCVCLCACVCSSLLPLPAGTVGVPNVFSFHGDKTMAVNTSDISSRPRFVDKVEARNKIWDYFTCTADSEDTPTNITKPVCIKLFETYADQEKQHVSQ